MSDQKIATPASAALWRERERLQAIKRFREEMGRATAQLTADLDFIDGATVYENDAAIWGGKALP